VTETLTLARRGDESAFRELTDPYRRELQLHCYRILGSVQDAEDALQETFLSAWRGLEDFEERASLRTWLYRIATNRCLNMLRAVERRTPPPPRFDSPPPTGAGEVLWLQPYPDELLEGIPDAQPGPAARYESKEAVALAFVSGLQHLPPRQRAALVLRDVLAFSSSEIASMLDTTEASVNSALQRARATLDARLPANRDRAPLPSSPRERELVTAFAEAFQTNDVDRLVTLLTDDALITMPPEPLEWQGRDAIHAFLTERAAARHPRRLWLIPTRANGQPAFGYYTEDVHTRIARNDGIFVLTLTDHGIAAITRFDSATLPWFGLPRTLEI
jgi:RNA polymerase sigma-70 factor (ECF subfamily)